LLLIQAGLFQNAIRLLVPLVTADAQLVAGLATSASTARVDFGFRKEACNTKTQRVLTLVRYTMPIVGHLLMVILFVKE
jgi:hypothetical protein